MVDRYLWGEVRRISPEAPVPVVRIIDRSEALGGAGNVAGNLYGLGCACMLIGVRGKDDAGERLAAMTRCKKIKSGMLTDPTRCTIEKTRVMGQHQQMFRFDQENTHALDTGTKTKLLSIFNAHFRQYDAVILSDYGKGIFQTHGLAQDIISGCRRHHIPVFVDPKGMAWERYDSATCATPNTKELQQVSGVDFNEDDQLAASLTASTRKRLNFDWCLLTRGARGMCLAGKEGEPTIIATEARKVYDVSGAGDTVIATLAVGVASGLSFLQSAKLANYAAGVVVGKVGTQPINLKELQTALRSTENAPTWNDSHRLVTLETARMQVNTWRAAGEKIVFTNGCFDLLHPGHIHLLNQASRLGSRLIVGLNTDASVRALKGSQRPILCQEDRVSMLSALSYVDLIILFAENTPMSLIKALRPDILVKGSDYQTQEVVGRRFVASYGGRVELIQLMTGHSTTRLMNEKLIQKPHD